MPSTAATCSARSVMGSWSNEVMSVFIVFPFRLGNQFFHQSHFLILSCTSQVFSPEEKGRGHGQHAVVDATLIQIGFFLQLSQCQIRGDDQRLPAEIAPVDHVIYGFQAEFGVPFHAQIVQDQQWAGAEQVNVRLPILKAVVDNSRQIGHTDGDLLLDQGVGDTGGQTGLACAHITPEQ